MWCSFINHFVRVPKCEKRNMNKALPYYFFLSLYCAALLQWVMHDSTKLRLKTEDAWSKIWKIREINMNHILIFTFDNIKTKDVHLKIKVKFSLTIRDNNRAGHKHFWKDFRKHLMDFIIEMIQSQSNLSKRQF